MDVPLLTTKLNIRPLRPSLVPRPRLLQKLDEGLREGCWLILVSAPAGYGKTTLVAEWLHHLRAAPAPGPAGSEVQVGMKTQADQPTYDLAWLSLDADDNDHARFMAYFIAALETIQADVGTGMRALFNSPQTPPLKSVLTTLINNLATLSTGLVLVLDDYHVIEHRSIHDALVFLVEHLPPQLHI